MLELILTIFIFRIPLTFFLVGFFVLILNGDKLIFKLICNKC